MTSSKPKIWANNKTTNDCEDNLTMTLQESRKIIATIRCLVIDSYLWFSRCHCLSGFVFLLHFIKLSAVTGFIHSFIHSFIHFLFTYLFIIYLFIYLLIYLLLIYLFIIYLFIYLFIIYFFIYLFNLNTVTYQHKADTCEY